MTNLTFRLDLDKEKVVSRFNPKFSQAQMWVDTTVIADCDQYVPFRDGFLAKSAILGTKIGSGEVVYNVPYAKRQYYGMSFKHNKDKHPTACAQWFEKAKGVRKQYWIDGANKIVRG